MAGTKRKINSKESKVKETKRLKLNNDLTKVLQETVFKKCDVDLILKPNNFINCEIENLKEIHKDEGVKKKFKEIQSDIQRIIASQFSKVKVELFGLRASGLGAPDGRLEIFVQSGETLNFLWEILLKSFISIFSDSRQTNRKRRFRQGRLQERMGHSKSGWMCGLLSSQKHEYWVHNLQWRL